MASLLFLSSEVRGGIVILRNGLQLEKSVEHQALDNERSIPVPSTGCTTAEERLTREI